MERVDKTIKYLNPFYKEVNRDEISNINIFSIAIKSNNGFACSSSSRGSLEKAEAKVRKLLKEYPECTIAEIRDSSLDSDKAYSIYGCC